MPAFQLIGHRGAKDEAPENTIAGFVHARQLGLTAVELDVHLSSDDELVVIHDSTVDRTTTSSGNVAGFTATQLAAMDARAAFPDWPEILGIPTLDQALDALGEMPFIQIEIKRDTEARMRLIVEALMDAIRRRELGSRVTLSSFERFAVREIARLAPEQARAYIGAYDDLHYLDTALELGCTQADMSLTLSSRQMVERALREGLRVIGFQCNSIETLERALSWGVDGATTDIPSTILPHLADA